MRAFLLGFVALTLAAGPAAAALTREQKVQDFLSVAALYATRYAPGEWKQQLFQANPVNLQPWLAQVAETTDDLGYLDVLVRYVASFKDTHSAYRINAFYFASLGFHVDVYHEADGRPVVLIDSITRSIQPISVFPAELGDELLSVDGVAVADWIERFRPYVGAGNIKSETRLAAGLITSRSQAVFARLADLGETANVEVRRRSGVREAYTLRWSKSGIPLQEIVTPRLTGPSAKTATASAPPAAITDDYLLEPLRRMMNERDQEPREILNYGSRTPIWPVPPGFEQRLGLAAADLFWSGIVTHRDRRIGIIRIPNFAPANTNTAQAQWEAELARMRDNTDGLVIDVTRNTGGSPCWAESLLGTLMDKPWQAFGRRFRVLWQDIQAIQSNLQVARGMNSPTVALLEARLKEFQEAYQAGQLSVARSNCELTLDREPNRNVRYTKPVLLLTDEFSTSAGDYFPAIFQDNARGAIYGLRTNGAGGSVTGFPVGFLSEGGIASVTGTMHFRNRVITADGFPETNYTENVGVHPDVAADLMTVENYRSGGRLWVQGFLNAMADRIDK